MSRLTQFEMVRSTLKPASALWGLVSRSRNFLYDRGFMRIRRLSAAVVSVGNITAGGTGKTPMTIYLARRLHEAGLHPVVLSRGYRSQGSGTRIVSDGERILLDAGQAGDEPVLIASSVPGVPVVVDPNRSRGGLEAIRRFHPGVILLDDGFQHRRLARELDIVLLDAVDPFGRYEMLPSGYLREPFSGLARAGLFVITHAPEGEPLGTLTAVLRRYNPKAPILRASHTADSLLPVTATPPGSGPLAAQAAATGLESLHGAAVFAFCGVGNPEGFRTTLQFAGAKVVGLQAFRDHHAYTEAELKALLEAARLSNAKMVVTTEKDAVRLMHLPAAASVYALRIRLTVSDEPALMGAVMAAVRR